MRQPDIGNNTKVSGQELADWLDAHPILKARIVGLVGLIENAETIVLADEAERRVIEELRGMGNELLTDWAQRRAVQAAQEVAGPHVTKHCKKNSAGTAPTAKSK